MNKELLTRPGAPPFIQLSACVRPDKVITPPRSTRQIPAETMAVHPPHPVSYRVWTCFRSGGRGVVCQSAERFARLDPLCGRVCVARESLWSTQRRARQPSSSRTRHQAL